MYMNINLPHIDLLNTDAPSRCCGSQSEVRAKCHDPIIHYSRTHSSILAQNSCRISKTLDVSLNTHTYQLLSLLCGLGYPDGLFKAPLGLNNPSVHCQAPIDLPFKPPSSSMGESPSSHPIMSFLLFPNLPHFQYSFDPL